MSVKLQKKDSLLVQRIKEQEAYIASRDYQVTKAAREGVDVEELYEGHKAWYKEQQRIINELEERCQRENPEAWQQILLRRNA